jgi:hypothetical protein
MTMQRIIHPLPEGGIAVVIPTGELPVQEIARKDVPAGIPYRIVTTDDLPSDRDFRAAWEADFSEADGYGIGAEAWFAEQEEVVQ